MADKQFYEFKLESDTTTESGSLPFINDLYSDIVNYDEVNPYYYNSGYKENLDHVSEEKAQKAKFGLVKMKPYEKLKLWKRNASETDLEEDTTEYEITDAVFLDGKRFLMALYDVDSSDINNRTRMKIFKQINIVEYGTCANNNYERGSAGNFVDITRYSYYSEAEDDTRIVTFTLASPGVVNLANHGFVGGEKVFFRTTGTLPTGITGGNVYYVVVVNANTFNIVNEWGSIPIEFTGPQAGVHRMGGTQVIDHFPHHNCLDRKFTIAAWGKGPKKVFGDHGYMKIQLAGEDLLYYFYDSNMIINAEAGDYLYINEGGLSGQIVPISGSTTVDNNQGVETIFPWTGVNLNEGEKWGLSAPHSWVIYNSYGDILNFVCSDGIIHLNHTGEKPSETQFTRCGAMADNTFDNKNVPGFMIGSMINFRPVDTIALYDVSDGEVKYGLSGFLKFYFKSTNSFFISNDFTDIVEFTDYIVMVGPNKTGLAYPYLDVNKPGIMSNLYRQIGDGYLNRGSWIADGSSFLIATNKGLWALELNAAYTVESRFVVVPTWKFQVGPFITDISHFSRELGDVMGMSMEEKQFRMYINNEEGTIIWIKSIEHNYWRQHIIPNRRISKYSAGVYIGDGVYDRGGKEEVKTYLAFHFGDKTLMNPKTIHSLKLALGRDSWISQGNTILQVTWTLSGRTYTVNFEDWNTAMWVAEMMALKWTGNEDDIYKQYQNEIHIFSGEGHGKHIPLMLYNKNKIKAFDDYNPLNIPTPFGSTSTTDFADWYILSNRANIHIDLGYMADIVTFKIITKGNNQLEFYGAQIWYDLTNEVGGSLDNSIVVKDSLEDGTSPNIPK